MISHGSRCTISMARAVLPAAVGPSRQMAGVLVADAAPVDPAEVSERGFSLLDPEADCMECKPKHVANRHTRREPPAAQSSMVAVILPTFRQRDDPAPAPDARIQQAQSDEHAGHWRFRLRHRRTFHSARAAQAAAAGKLSLRRRPGLVSLRQQAYR